MSIVSKSAILWGGPFYFWWCFIFLVIYVCNVRVDFDSYGAMYLSPVELEERAKRVPYTERHVGKNAL